MLQHRPSSYPGVEDDLRNQSGKRGASSQADDQARLKRRAGFSSQTPSLETPETNTVYDSIKVVSGDLTNSSQLNGYLREALPRQPDRLPKPRADGRVSGHHRPGHLKPQMNHPSITLPETSNSSLTGRMANRSDPSTIQGPMNASGRPVEAEDPHSSDSDNQPLLARHKSKVTRTGGLETVNVKDSTDLEEIFRTPSGKLYHCFRSGSIGGPAVFPDGYRLEPSNKCALGFEWICAMRDCRALFAGQRNLNQHFMQAHGNLTLNDNMDGTVSMVGRRNGTSSRSIVVSQRPAPATLVMAKPRLTLSIQNKYRGLLPIETEGSDPLSAKERQSRDRSPPPVVGNVPSSFPKDLDPLLDASDALVDAQKSDLWSHIESFLPTKTKATFTEGAQVSEIRALRQLLSYPRRKNLKGDWVTIILGEGKRPLLTVVTLLIRAVSDASLLCNACSAEEDRARRCSFLRNIKPEHEALKRLAGGKCCYCVLHGTTCRMSFEVPDGRPKTMPKVPSPEPRSDHLSGSEDRDHRMKSSLSERRQQPTLPSGQHSARVLSQTPSAMIKQASTSPWLPPLESTPRLLGEEANLSGSGTSETFGSVMHRAVMLGIAIKRLESHERSSMLQWITAILSCPRLGATQQILELVATIQKAPLEMQDELRQKCLGALRALLPEAAIAECMATILATPAVSPELGRDILSLVVAMHKVRSEDQDGLGERVLSTFNACL